MRERDKLWKRNLICKYNEIPKWKRDYCGNAIKPKVMVKFQWERDKYSTALNIQNR